MICKEILWILGGCVAFIAFRYCLDRFFNFLSGLPAGVQVFIEAFVLFFAGMVVIWLYLNQNKSQDSDWSNIHCEKLSSAPKPTTNIEEEVTEKPIDKERERNIDL